MGYCASLAAVLASLAVARPALAWDLGEPDGPSALTVHGFVSQGYIRSTGNDYLINSKAGSFEFSEAGVNLNVQLSDRFRVAMQLFAYDLGPDGKFTLRADWGFLEYRLRDWLGLRIGRVKLVLGMYSDIADIDAARTQILLPISIYPLTDRNLLFGVSGGEIFGFANLGRAGGLDYQVLGGAISIALPNTIGPDEATLDVPALAAGRLMWETPLDGLRLGGSVLVLKATENAFLQSTMATPSAFGSEREMIYSAVGSVEYAAHDLLLAAEYGLERGDLSGDLAPPGTTVAEGGYGMAGYRLTRWLQPAVYYSVEYPNRANRSGRENFQDDLAGTLRFDVGPHWIIKLEGHYMHGTASINTTPSPGVMLDKAAQAAAPENWALFLAKMTGYF